MPYFIGYFALNSQLHNYILFKELNVLHSYWFSHFIEFLTAQIGSVSPI